MPSLFILAMLAIAVACAGPTDGFTPYADAIRKIGVDHVLYASDEQPGDQHQPTNVNWKEMRSELPLTPSEFRTIAGNVAPYIR